MKQVSLSRINDEFFETEIKNNFKALDILKELICKQQVSLKKKKRAWKKLVKSTFKKLFKLIKNHPLFTPLLRDKKKEYISYEVT